MAWERQVITRKEYEAEFGQCGESPNDKLSLWTVYDHPSDYPDRYVARLFLIGRGSVEPTASMIAAPTLAMLREHLLEMGLIRLKRDPTDDAKIVENWL